MHVGLCVLFAVIQSQSHHKAENVTATAKLEACAHNFPQRFPQNHYGNSIHSQLQIPMTLKKMDNG